MSSRLRAIAVTLTLVMALAACGGTPALVTGPKLPPDTVCLLSMVEGTLHGDPSDDHLAWLVTASGARRELEWPSGFTARFVPHLEILAPNGDIVAREGDGLKLGGAGALRSDAFAICEVHGTFYPGT